MTVAQLKKLSCAKIEELAQRALLLDEILEASERSRHWTLANILEDELAELTQLRRRVHYAHEAAFGK